MLLDILIIILIAYAGGWVSKKLKKSGNEPNNFNEETNINEGIYEILNMSWKYGGVD